MVKLGRGLCSSVTCLLAWKSSFQQSMMLTGDCPKDLDRTASVTCLYWGSEFLPGDFPLVPLLKYLGKADTKVSTMCAHFMLGRNEMIWVLFTYNTNFCSRHQISE